MKIKAFFIFISVILFSLRGFTQSDSSKTAISVNCDVTNQYIWRGQLLNKSVNFQPAITFTKCGFSAGAWGTYAINGEYAEADIFLAYEYKWFKLTVYDYFTMDNNLSNNDYFEYEDNKTKHILEPTIEINGGDNLPLRLAASVFAYGLDKDTAGKNYYSSYIEMGYTFAIAEYEIDLFTGFTPKTGFYGDYEGVVNAGLSVTREIKITDHFTLPVKSAIITNPQKENIFLVFTLSL